MSTGGSVTEITLNGRPFSVDAEADLGLKLQIYENEVKPNGNGTQRIIRKNVPQSLDGVVVAIDDDLGDLEFLTALNDSGEFADMTAAMPSGDVYAGKVILTGEVKKQTQDASAEITMMGFGITKQ